MNRVETELLPCPFCGQTRIYLNPPSSTYPRGSINCPACLVCMPCEVSESELIDCWNRRSTPIAAGSGEASPIEGLRLIERDDDALICAPHWQGYSKALARRPALMSNEDWRPIANRIIAALSSGRIGEETEEDRRERILETVVSPDNSPVPEVLAAMLVCAEAWAPEARIIGNVRAGDIARALRSSLSRKTAGEAVPVAWVFELASWYDAEAKEYTLWDKPQLSFEKPTVPAKAIRNLRPLVFASPPSDTEEKTP